MDDPIGSQLLFQLLLILINAFFASTETAVVSLNENKVRKQAEDGDKRAALMLHMIESPTRFCLPFRYASRSAVFWPAPLQRITLHRYLQAR